MPGNDEYRLRQRGIGTRQYCVDVFHVSRLIVCAGAGSLELVDHHLQLPSRRVGRSVRRMTIWSRPQPAPRLGSSHEESELRVPQATSRSTSSRIDLSSTAPRCMAPAGRGKIFGFGLFCIGSAGSFRTEPCAATGTVDNATCPSNNQTGLRGLK